jgi:hypothetical protein
MIDFYARLLLGLEPDKIWRDWLMTAMRSRKEGEQRTAQQAVALILAMPEAQMS